MSIDARLVVIRVRVRRLACPTRGCCQTFREQLPGVLERYQRRTSRLISQVGAVVRELAGRGGARLLSVLAVVVSRHTALRALLRLPLPERRVSRVLGVDDFALCRRRRYATVLIDCPRPVGRGSDPLSSFQPAGAAQNGGIYRCEYCGKEVFRRPSVVNGRPQRGLPDYAQIDHVEPKPCGGCGLPHNGAVACRACNRDKSAKTLGQWDSELREFLPGPADATHLDLYSYSNQGDDK